MNAMIDPLLLKKYLAGNASESEIQQCEELLADPSFSDRFLGDLDGLPSPDSLVETLRNLGSETATFEPDSDNSQSLVEQVQRFVANQQIDQQDLDRILSPAGSEDELGRIAHYRVIEFIAGGGMGLVFKAEDSNLKRLVCIKVLNPTLAQTSDAKARFSREAKAAARLRNSRIVTVLEFGEHQGLPYLVMELLEGMSLRNKLNIEGMLESEVAKKISLQIAEGLRYAHGLGYLHRDIKPENVWITPEGDVKLLDFGLARSIEETTNLTRTGTILGTPNYMSPEQVRGEELDERSDLFSVGSVLFEMLTGESPFGKPNLFSTMMSVANDSISFPEETSPIAIPGSLKPLVHALLQKNPSDRIESAESLINALNNIGEFNQANAASTTFNPRRRTLGFRSWVIGLLSGLAGAACLAVALLLYQLNDKGTLVVEADPSVSVSIANEEVSIEDPETNEKFKVAIGEHPLASGVYQLEMTDKSGRYTLSSDVIVIRRGEKQIVRVELKPDESAYPVKESKSIAVAPESKLTLAKLPTLSAVEVRRKLNIVPGESLFRNAIVTTPKPIEGVTSWAIEPVFSASTDLKFNADGSRIATTGRYEDNRVGIWSRNGEPTHLIPAQDKVKHVQWSPHPDIFAVVENGDAAKQIVVWKLFERHAEVINVIPANGEKVFWSPDGLQLAIETETEISFVDLSKGGLFAHPNFGIRGKISDRPWSADGRYFATTVDKDVNVWDLNERKLFHIFNGKQLAQFLPEGNRIALKLGRDWEVWNLDSFVRERVLEHNADWLNSWPSPQFDKVAGVTKTGELILEDLENGEVASGKLTVESYFDSEASRGNEFRSAKLAWTGNGLGFACQIGWSGTSVSNRVSIKDKSVSDFFQLKAIKPFKRNFVRIGDSRHERLRDVSKSGHVAYFSTLTSLDQLGSFAGFDLNERKHFPATKFSIGDSGAQCRLSPNGKYIAVVGSDVVSENGVLAKEWAADIQKVRICSTDSGELVKTLETGVVRNLLWSPDSTSLILSTAVTKEEPWDIEKGNRGRYGEVALQIIKKGDSNRDGILSVEEASQSTRIFKKDMDSNNDGNISMEELVERIVPDSRKTASDKFSELETTIYHVDRGVHVPLRLDEMPKSSSPDAVELCFQRGSSGFNARFVSPVIYKNQIVLPLIEKTSFRGGSRNSRSTGEAAKDKLGFFDFQTGALTETIELNHRFDGDRFSLNDDWILTKFNGERGNLNTFVAFDRKNGNRPVYPNTLTPAGPFTDRNARRNWERILASNGPQGNAYLSPTHAYVAVTTKNGIEIWSLSSDQISLSQAYRINRKGARPGAISHIAWHPTAPILGWIRDYEIHWCDVEKNERSTIDLLSICRDLRATNEGWLAMASGGIVQFDKEFNVSRTYLSTERFKTFDSAGSFDQCITADGDIMNPETTSNLRVIQLKGKRVETLTIEEFEGQKSN